MRRLSTILIIVLQFAPAGLAQAPDNPPPAPAQSETQQPSRPTEDDVVKITTNLVQVDAVVTDKNGKLIRDLRQEEVQILEDGRQQKITNFSFVTSEAPPSGPAAPTALVDKTAPPLPPIKLHPEDIRRTIALVVDDLGLSFVSTSHVRGALKKFVDEQMQPGDLVAIIRTSGGIGALQQFTADKRQLYAAIDRVKWYVNGRSGVGVFAPIEGPLENASGQREARLNDDDFNRFREDVFAVGTLGAVGYVVKGMRELPGRKSILLISDGFRITSPDDPERNYRALQALRRLIDQANRGTVVIYTMNASGLQVLGLSAADSVGSLSAEQLEEQLSSRRAFAFESQEGLDYLAHETGGFAIRNNNDLSAGVRRVIEDQKSYYLIGYRPDESTFDPKTGRRTFHKLSLKITRPGKFNVRVRNGFYGVSEDQEKTIAATPRQKILAALTSPFGAAGVHLRLTTLFANDAKVGSYMRSLLHIDANDLTFKVLPGGWHQAEFDIVAVAFGDNGNVVGQVSKAYTIKRSAEDYQRLRRDGIVYFMTVPIKKAGAYQLRAALRDRGSEQVGSAGQFIEVPDIKKNRLVVSGVLVSGIDSAAIKASAKAGVAPVNESAANKSPESNEDGPATLLKSAATRQFKRGQPLQYSVAIYNARLDKATAQPQLRIQLRIFLNGKLVFTGKETAFVASDQTDLKRIAVGGALQIG